MSLNVRITGDFGAVNRALKKHPGLAHKAASRAINRALLTTRKETVREASRAARVKARLIRKRIALHRASPKPDRLVGAAYFHTQPIPAHSLVYPKEARALKRGGVRAGQHTFKKAFLGVYRRGKRTGKPNIFEYRAGSKTRVVRSLLVIKQHGKILHKVYGRLARKRFLKIFHADLKYRLKKQAGSL